jgi:hypothetical protein
LPCCVWSSISWLLTASKRWLAPFVKTCQGSSCCWHMLVILERTEVCLLMGRSSPPCKFRF